MTTPSPSVGAPAPGASNPQTPSTMPRDPAGLAEYMQRELDAVLRELGGNTTDDDPIKGEEPIYAAPPVEVPDLVADPINDFRVGDSVNRRVTTNPPFAVAVRTQHVESNVCVDIPIVEPRPAENLVVNTTVSPLTSGADSGFMQFTQITRAANNRARASGSMVATVVSARTRQEKEAVEEEQLNREQGEKGGGELGGA